ncbi:hypothetical protein HPB52_001952 [Rhipicephalus sanguineus]|uniref:Reductase n=1 Tax=Rhipicephalus sanguineus TaxID=34632 RepID=A0A9D4PTV5_RHISA|nr:hypothetical protein HPB52_001952 [Rhipicephalus sanguineus]
MARLDGKVTLITGASSGIGQATAVYFASLGSWLVLNGRRKDALDKVAQLCHDKGVPKEKVLVVVGDVCKEDDVAAIVNETLKHFGKIDILVNSAGILKNGTTENTPLSVYDEIMNVNLRSIFYMMQLAIPHLKKTKGTIVNVSSVTGLRAFPNVVAYNISKAGLDQLTRTAALELAADGVRFLEHCKTTHALGRVGTAEEVARSIAFLASDDSSFITGQTLAIDGGRSVMCPR